VQIVLLVPEGVFVKVKRIAVNIYSGIDEAEKK
jgi:hypothetical protein